VLIGIFSDAHGHIDGFCRARDLLYSYGVRKFFYLGDAVGYIPLASVVHELRNESHILSLRGNHEDMLLTNQPGERDDKDLYQHHIVRDLLDENDLTFLLSHAFPLVTIFHSTVLKHLSPCTSLILRPRTVATACS